MAGEILGEFVSSVIGVGDDPVHDPGRFQHGQIAVRGTRRQRGRVTLDLGDRERAIGTGEYVDERGPGRRHALAVGSESAGDGVAQLVVGRRRRHGAERT